MPQPSNPTYSLSLPGPAAMGVPNFFIDSFQIPPFLIPIYQAAGIEYQVPWQVLAGINEIETDYGRNLSVSSAGAVGWMQFLPSTWKTWGVDANGDGIADPYNPVDAIFTAARYLHAAGASKNLSQSIFAYNHATWYVQSVLLRAKLIGGIPNQLLGALTGLVQGHFPVDAPAKYADSSVVKLSKNKVHSGNAAIAIDSNPNTKGTSIFARQGSPVIAVNDGKILKVGDNSQLGHYIVLQDATGNVYTYSQLGSVAKKYPVPKPVKITARDIAQELAAPVVHVAPTAPASAGQQLNPRGQDGSQDRGQSFQERTLDASSSKPAAPLSLPSSPPPARQTQSVTAPMVKERLFANPVAGRLLRRRRRPAAQELEPADHQFPELLLRRVASGQEPVHAQAAKGRLDHRRRHGPRPHRRPLAARLPASVLPDPPGGQERAAGRPQADPRWLEAVRGDGRLSRCRRRSLLRPRAPRTPPLARSC